MPEKTYTETELVSFGNYMLNQDKRKRREPVRNSVTHADVENWKTKQHRHEGER